MREEIIGNCRLILGDCLDVLRTIPDNSVDSIVTDPPYGLSFMGKKWDYDVPSVEIWAECLRVLKPGGHLLAFAGTRTQHRMAVRIEDAGFEIRDMIAWVYGSGFPKSLDVSKAIDKAAGAEREVVGENPNHRAVSGVGYEGVYQGGNTGAAVITAPATDAARQWQGWGTALKPSLEPVTVARKPLAGTVAENVLRHGTGALNIDGCRVGLADGEDADAISARSGGVRGFADAYVGGKARGAPPTDMSKGRWPANLIHDGSEEVLALFPAKAGASAPVKGTEASAASVGNVTGERARVPGAFHADSGSAARFFYCPKASKRDRDEGLDGFAQATPGQMTDREDGSAGLNNPRAGAGRTGGGKNIHPTVKPTELMAYLCRLVTPPGGVVLDPFMGSGSTGKAAMREGFRFIGIEREPKYFDIACRRIEDAYRQPRLIMDEQPDLFA